MKKFSEFKILPDIQGMILDEYTLDGSEVLRLYLVSDKLYNSEGAERYFISANPKIDILSFKHLDSMKVPRIQ